MNLASKALVLAFLSIGIMEMVHVFQRKYGLRDLVSRQPALVRWSLYYFVVIAIIFFGVYEDRQFIYFQF